MKEIILVGAGSALGGIGRYLLGHLAGRFFVVGAIPFGTLFVNMLGCFLAGIFVDRFLAGAGDNLRLLLLVGFCGGFTTFSAFGVETIHLIHSGNIYSAITYVILSVILGLSAVRLGLLFNSAF
jgi:CrcB protein